MISTDFERLLLALYEARGDFVLIGGLAAGGEKDSAALPVLRRTLRETRNRVG